MKLYETVMHNKIIIVCLGPPRIELLQDQFHAELGKNFQINCTAINGGDASMNMVFSWKTPKGVQFNVTTTDEDDSRTATSTLHISRVTHRHAGLYQCIVKNGGPVMSITSSQLVVQGEYWLIHYTAGVIISHAILVHPSKPRELGIVSEGIDSLTLAWNNPVHPRGSIDHFKVNLLTL